MDSWVNSNDCRSLLIFMWKSEDFKAVFKGAVKNSRSSELPYLDRLALNLAYSHVSLLKPTGQVQEPSDSIALVEQEVQFGSQAVQNCGQRRQVEEIG